MITDSKGVPLATAIWLAIPPIERFCLVALGKTAKTVTIGDLRRVRVALRAVFVPTGRELS